MPDAIQHAMLALMESLQEEAEAAHRQKGKGAAYTYSFTFVHMNNNLLMGHNLWKVYSVE